MPHEITDSKGNKYYIHYFRDVNLKGGRVQRIYYYSRDPKSKYFHEIPKGCTSVDEEKMKNGKETKESKDQISMDSETLRYLYELAIKQRSTTKTFFMGTILGILVGAIFCIAGLIITLMGLTGSIEWFFKAGNFTSRLVNAGPGVFFALLGMIILWRYKPKGKDSLEVGPFLKSDIVFKMPFRMFHRDTLSKIIRPGRR